MCQSDVHWMSDKAFTQLHATTTTTTTTRRSHTRELYQNGAS